jgi:hypothetical protein
MFAPARIILPAPCRWDNRLHTNPVFNGAGFFKHTQNQN